MGCTDWRLLTDAPLTIYRDLSEACLDDAVDAIVIATPNHTHRDVLHAVAASQNPCCSRNRWPRPWRCHGYREPARDYPAVIQLGMQYASRRNTWTRCRRWPQSARSGW
ncbi:MAG: hypothetical protein CM15mP74_28760 [Halieaceae bacterium]|nr:MAG: hypothetical protein CM15mP74_28760 [Halieaceae bacterium]